MRYFVYVIFMWLSFCACAYADCVPLQPHENMIGELQFYKIKKGDNFTKLAQKYDVGYDQLQAANPSVDSVNPLVNAAIIIPSEFIIPNVPHKGIVVNLAEMRLFYFPKGEDKVCTYPVGIGKQNWQTPEGKLFIAQKIKNPVWIVPDAIMKYRKKHGDPVPKIMQSGPDNPLGYFAMRLSQPTYLIHGTNEPDSIGRRSSAGCIHLFGKDIESLFAMTPVHTRVHIVNQPYLLAKQNDSYYFAAFKPLIEMQNQFSADPKLEALMLQKLVQQASLNPSKKYETELQKIASTPTGIPLKIDSDANVNKNSAAMINPKN